MGILTEYAHFAYMASKQNIHINRYQIIPRVLIFLFRGDEVLLLKINKPTSIWHGQLNGAGGHMEQGEDPLTAAKRELLEETGLTAVLKLCGVVMIDTGEQPGIGLFVFSGENASGELVSGSEGQAAWIKLAELESLPVLEDVPILIKKIKSLLTDESPFIGRSHYDAEGRLVLEFSK